jgi:hypothetical protein
MRLGVMVLCAFWSRIKRCVALSCVVCCLIDDNEWEKDLFADARTALVEPRMAPNFGPKLLHFVLAVYFF